MAVAKKNANQSQSDAFMQAARDLECDESEEAFRRNLRNIAKVPVEKKPKR